MVVNVLAPRTPVEAVQIGGTTYLRGDNSTAVAAHTGASTLAAVGAIIEVKPFQQACERCDTCPCIGCGHRCECSCNALCRQRREPNCAHTAGVLSPGRWYIGIDAPAEFTLTATLVGALALRTGEALGPRTLFGAGAQPLIDARASSSEGAAFADYFSTTPRPTSASTSRLICTGPATPRRRALRCTSASEIGRRRRCTMPRWRGI